MPKRTLIYLILSLILLTSAGVIGYLSWQKNQPRIILTSQFPDFKPYLDDNHRRRLEKYLEEIHFWDQGVVYGTDVIQGQTQLKQLKIILTPNWQDYSQVYHTGGTRVASSSFTINGQQGTLTIYLIPNNQNLADHSSYILGELFQIASWPRSEYKFDSEAYRQQQQEFYLNYQPKYGVFLQI